MKKMMNHTGSAMILFCKINQKSPHLDFGRENHPIKWATTWAGKSWKKTARGFPEPNLPWNWCQTSQPGAKSPFARHKTKWSNFKKCLLILSSFLFGRGVVGLGFSQDCCQNKATIKLASLGVENLLLGRDAHSQGRNGSTKGTLW